MLEQILKDRSVPELKGREEMLDIMQKEVYGYLPAKPDKLTWTVKNNYIGAFCAGKATAQYVELTAQMGEKTFTFPFMAVIPTSAGPHPFFIHINFRPNVPDRYMHSEEIIDNGFACLSFCYEDVTKDNGDFTSGLAGVLYENGERKPTDAGKIAMWAWAAQRVMDYAEQEPRLDKSCAIVCGHSRLGKTALFCGATDERFKFVYSNNSGCSGAAITRDKVGETVEAICRVFPFWFCENYKQYVNREHDMPFDQHYLIAAVAPRNAYVASAWEDQWADPASEMLACVAAAPAYEKLGLAGFVCEDRLPKVGDVYHEGNIGYHLRAGLHYFSREDWNKAIAFINSKK
ncbi:MAG: hypothetical protein IJY39_13190 [Clostridia bacterium]|nr:hypothetical protein [Clostridia bacterium]